MTSWNAAGEIGSRAPFFQPGGVTALALSRDGRIHVAGPRGARTWTATGELVHALEDGPDDGTRSGDLFAPDARLRVALVRRDPPDGPVLRMWDLSTGRIRGELRAPDDAERLLALDPNGAFAIVAGPARAVLVSLEDGRVHAPLGERPVQAAGFLPDGTVVFVDEQGALARLDGTAPRQIAPAPEAYAVSEYDPVAIPSLSMFAVATQAAVMLRVFGDRLDVRDASGAVLYEGAFCRHAAVSTDGTCVFLGSDEGGELLEISTRRTLRSVETGRSDLAVFHPDGRFLLTALAQSGDVRAWPIEPGVTVAPATGPFLPDAPCALAGSSAGDRLLVSSAWEGTWSAATAGGDLVRVGEAHGSRHGCVLREDGRAVIAMRGVVSLAHPQGKESERVPVEYRHDFLCVSPGGAMAAYATPPEVVIADLRAASAGPAIRLAELPWSEPGHSFDGEPAYAISDDGHRLAQHSSNGLAIWRLPDGAIEAAIPWSAIESPPGGADRRGEIEILGDGRIVFATAAGCGVLDPASGSTRIFPGVRSTLRPTLSRRHARIAFLEPEPPSRGVLRWRASVWDLESASPLGGPPRTTSFPCVAFVGDLLGLATDDRRVELWRPPS